MMTNDLTKRADLTRHGKGTGALRNRRPDYVNFLPPCNDACPAGENIQAWLALAQAEGGGPAWSNSLFEDNAEFGLGMRIAADHLAGIARQLVTELAPQVGEEFANEILNSGQ